MIIFVKTPPIDSLRGAWGGLSVMGTIARGVLTHAPMMNLGEVLGLVPGQFLARPQNVPKIHVLTCFDRGHRTLGRTH